MKEKNLSFFFTNSNLYLSFGANVCNQHPGALFEVSLLVLFGTTFLSAEKLIATEESS